MNRDIARLTARINGLGKVVPALEGPVTPLDLAVDDLMTEAVALGPGSLAAVGAGLEIKVCPVLYWTSVRTAARGAAARSRWLGQLALAAAVTVSHDETEPRELMISLAPHQVGVTMAAGPDAAVELFDWAAAELPIPYMAEMVRGFGRRTDITLPAFGTREFMGPTGVWFGHSPPRPT